MTAINGTPLDDRDRSEQILSTLSSSSEARVTVIRGGQQQDLVLNIAQVAQEADSLAAQSQGAAGAAARRPRGGRAMAAPPPPVGRTAAGPGPPPPSAADGAGP